MRKISLARQWEGGEETKLIDLDVLIIFLRKTPDSPPRTDGRRWFRQVNSWFQDTVVSGHRVNSRFRLTWILSDASIFNFFSFFLIEAFQLIVFRNYFFK